ncbi:ABC transporter ATP-binding protein (plasmid) [Deinococcus metallilatus]|nr:ABC transporter ATP-binding protein [Deinococcus metallilatus]
MELHGVALAYGGQPVLAGVNLRVEAGQVLGVLGRSGSGKSTLLHVLAGLLEPDTGEVCLSGRATTTRERRGQSGFVPQRPSLLPWRTVLGNLTLALELRGERGPGARRRALDLLAQFNLAEAANLWPYQLSGGMGQRVAVLRAALFARDLLLLDEPFSALDALTRLEFQRWLAGLHAEWRPTVVLVTHDVREALALCDRVVVLGGKPARVVLERGNLPTLRSPGADPRPLEGELLTALLGQERP